MDHESFMLRLLPWNPPVADVSNDAGRVEKFRTDLSATQNPHGEDDDFGYVLP
jgi:hypothetical protein